MVNPDICPIAEATEVMPITPTKASDRRGIVLSVKKVGRFIVVLLGCVDNLYEATGVPGRKDAAALPPEVEKSL